MYIYIFVGCIIGYHLKGGNNNESPKVYLVLFISRVCVFGDGVRYECLYRKRNRDNIHTYVRDAYIPYSFISIVETVA